MVASLFFFMKKSYKSPVVIDSSHFNCVRAGNQDFAPDVIDSKSVSYTHLDVYKRQSSLSFSFVLVFKYSDIELFRDLIWYIIFLLDGGDLSFIRQSSRILGLFDLHCKYQLETFAYKRKLQNIFRLEQLLFLRMSRRKIHLSTFPFLQTFSAPTCFVQNEKRTKRYLTWL